jgi:peptidase A4-like protein
MRTIHLENDIKVQTFEHCAGLDPMTATRGELIRAGLPARPGHPEALAHYEHFFTSTKDRFHYIDPTFDVMPTRTAADALVATKNWSGLRVSGDSIKSISAQWVVPDVHMSGDGTITVENNAAIWIGIDGTPQGTGPFPLQAGVVCIARPDGSMSFVPFASWHSSNITAITNLAVNVHDTVIVTICTANGSRSPEATVYFANHSTGASTSFEIFPESGTALEGLHAEFVVEKQNFAGIPIGLANYGSVRFQAAMVDLADTTPVDLFGGDTLDLVIDNRTVSKGAVVSGNAVQCVYQP